MMKRAGVTLCFLIVLTALLCLSPATQKAAALPQFFVDNCTSCHAAAPQTCDGCHAHGTHSSSAKDNINVAGATNKATFTPGETVSVTITGGYRNLLGRWVRAILYDQSMNELARSTGPAGIGGGLDFPITLTAPAPTAPGAYTWNVAWYGNQYDLSEAQGTPTFFGPRWTPDPNNSNHGQEIVATNSFTVAAAAAPAITLNPASLSFGSVNVGSAASRTTQIQNTGTAALNVTAIARAAGTSTEYTFTPAAPFTIDAGGSMTLSVTYTPVDTGTDTGSLVITSNASTSPTSLQLTGTGTAPPPAAQPVINLNPSALDFGTAAVGGVPAVRTTSIQNTGTADLNVTGIALSAGTSSEFTFAPAAPFTVAPSASATLTVTYTPVDAGTDTGSLTINSNDPAHPSVTLAVTGTGTVTQPAAPAIQLNPASLAFGTVNVGSTKALTTQIQNTGTAVLNVTGISLCPGTPTEFSWSPGTPITVVPGGSATLTVSFNPVDADAHTGCLSIASNDPAAPSVTLAVTAAGNLPPPPPNPQPSIELQPTSLDFGTVVTGGSVSSQLKVTNTGTAALDVSSIALCSGTSTEFSWSPSAPVTIAAGAELMFTVAYTPVDVGTDTGCLEIASNDPVSPVVQVNLTGTGVQSPSGLDLEIKRFRATKEVDVGEPVRFRLVVKNAGQVAGQAPATLVGTQKRAEVYRETITVSAPVGKKPATFTTFPPFTPTATGKIRWTVTIQDQSPGHNRATAVTEVEGQEKDRGDKGEADKEEGDKED